MKIEILNSTFHGYFLAISTNNNLENFYYLNTPLVLEKIQERFSDVKIDCGIAYFQTKKRAEQVKKWMLQNLDGFILADYILENSK
ncbi:MAG: hypothetical protein ACOCP8_02015 [archaeon]